MEPFEIENRRQAYLEHLYERSGRRCCTYTGLYQEHVRALIERDMAEVLGDE